MSISAIIPAVRPAGAPLPVAEQAARVSALPEVRPGQLWLVEAPAADGAVPATLRHVLDRVNVVIYERGHADRLRLALPLGAYAEPTAAGEGAAADAARCVRFARDGWSVVRLLPPGLAPRERVACLRGFTEQLFAARAPGHLPVTVLAEGADGITEEVPSRLGDLVTVAATYPRDTRLAIVVDAPGERAATLHAVVANGLAG